MSVEANVCVNCGAFVALQRRPPWGRNFWAHLNGLVVCIANNGDTVAEVDE